MSVIIRFLFITFLFGFLGGHISYAQDIDQSNTIKSTTLDSTWLLRPKVGRVFYEDDIYALNKSGNLYLSFSDVIDILELAVDFDPSTGLGSGWFLREDWNIAIDLQKGNISSRGETYSLQPGDVVTHEGSFFLREGILADVLSMTFDADTEQQYLEIASPYPLPGVARYYRNLKKAGKNSSFPEARLPRKEIEYDWLDLNTADVRMNTRYRDPKGSVGGEIFRSGSVAIEGQALKHQAYTFVNGDSRNNLTNVVARLSKRDEDAVLLGPLKARSYTLGDTQVADIPLTGDARQELGFHITNSRQDNLQFLTTDINGDALPGWDIELYRNGVLLSSLIVGDDAFYEFPDVELFAGANEFELFFYGPQGEVRNRKVQVPVTAALLSTQDNTYDVSVSLSETNTFRKLREDDIDRETPHVAARYNKVIGNMLTYIGVRNRDIEGENKTFFGTGFTGLVNNTVIDGNIGVDDDANVASEIALRKNINDWNLSLTGGLQSDDYIVDEVDNPKVLRVSGNAQKSFLLGRAKRGTFFTGGEYSETAEPRSAVDSRLGFAYQHGPFNVSNSLLYSRTEQTTGDIDTRLNNSLSLRGSFGKFFIRGGIDYDLQPVSQVDRYFSQLNYYPNNRFAGEVRLDHEPERDFTKLRLGANYLTNYFRSSPFVEIDNQNELLLGVNLNFNLIDTPFDKKPLITSDRSLGRGLVSSFVFHDKNGNNTYDEQDEPLPDVTVSSVNVRRRAETNEGGHSLLNRLPTTRATDIELDAETLPDPYMIPATEGVSILPSAGEIVELEFPVHMAGEVDGTVFLRQAEGGMKPLKRADVLLYNISQRSQKVIKATAAFDGFYVASHIPPGKYIATVSDQTIKRVSAGGPTPKIIDISYEGNIVYGLNFELNNDEVHVPVDVVYDDVSFKSVQYALEISEKPKSKLLGLLKEIKGRENSAPLYEGLDKLKDSASGVNIYTLPSNDLEESYLKCREFASQAMPCTLKVYVPTSNIQMASKTVN